MVIFWQLCVLMQQQNFHCRSINGEVPKVKFFVTQS